MAPVLWWLLLLALAPALEGRKLFGSDQSSSMLPGDPIPELAAPPPVTTADRERNLFRSKYGSGGYGSPLLMSSSAYVVHTLPQAYAALPTFAAASQLPAAPAPSLRFFTADSSPALPAWPAASPAVASLSAPHFNLSSSAASIAPVSAPSSADTLEPVGSLAPVDSLSMRAANTAHRRLAQQPASRTASVGPALAAFTPYQFAATNLPPQNVPAAVLPAPAPATQAAAPMVHSRSAAARSAAPPLPSGSTADVSEASAALSQAVPPQYASFQAATAASLAASPAAMPNGGPAPAPSAEPPVLNSFRVQQRQLRSSFTPIGYGAATFGAPALYAAAAPASPPAYAPAFIAEAPASVPQAQAALANSALAPSPSPYAAQAAAPLGAGPHAAAPSPELVATPAPSPQLVRMPDAIATVPAPQPAAAPFGAHPPRSLLATVPAVQPEQAPSANASAPAAAPSVPSGAPQPAPAISNLSRKLALASSAPPAAAPMLQPFAYAPAPQPAAIPFPAHPLPYGNYSSSSSAAPPNYGAPQPSLIYSLPGSPAFARAPYASAPYPLLAPVPSPARYGFPIRMPFSAGPIPAPAPAILAYSPQPRTYGPAAPFPMTNSPSAAPYASGPALLSATPIPAAAVAPTPVPAYSPVVVNLPDFTQQRQAAPSPSGSAAPAVAFPPAAPVTASPPEASTAAPPAASPPAVMPSIPVTQPPAASQAADASPATNITQAGASPALPISLPPSGLNPVAASPPSPQLPAATASPEATPAAAAPPPESLSTPASPTYTPAPIAPSADSIPPPANATGSSEVPPSPPAAAGNSSSASVQTAPVVTWEATLIDIDITVFQDQQDDYINTVAQGAGVPPSWVKILSARPGSVIVETQIVYPADNATSAAQLAATLFTNTSAVYPSEAFGPVEVAHIQHVTTQPKELMLSPSPVTQPPQAAPSMAHSGIGAGAIVGIIFGVLVLLAFVGFAISWCCKVSKRDLWVPFSIGGERSDPALRDPELGSDPSSRLAHALELDHGETPHRRTPRPIMHAVRNSLTRSSWKSMMDSDADDDAMFYNQTYGTPTSRAASSAAQTFTAHTLGARGSPCHVRVV